MKMLKHFMQYATTAEETGLSRRSFLKATGGATAGLVVGYYMPTSHARAATGDDAFNAFVQIATDGTVTVLNKHQDMGQGNMTGLVTLVAEELDANWDQMKGAFAPSDPKKYANLNWGTVQGTGGSSAIPNSFVQYREAGAAARAMLVAAAARSWGVPATEISVADGVISHPSGKKGSFGEFAAAASAETPPEKPVLKSPDAFKFIGKKKAHGRVDTAAKSTGQATYTQDVQRPGMLIAVVARPPKFGATVASVDDKAARAIKGVADVVQIPQGVAVLADNTWTAMQGRDALSITWDESKAELGSTEKLVAHYRELAEQPGPVAVEGDADGALAGAATVVEATYEFPYLAHAPMEPMNAVAELKPGQSLEVWTGSQIQTLDHGTAAKIAELPMENVQIHTLYAGGSFGRRANPTSDFVNEAVHVAKAINGRAPVKLVWTREDDIRGGYYRPVYVHKVRAGLNADGEIVGWHHRIVGQSIVKGTPFQGMIQNGIDPTSTEGATHLPYAVGAHRVELHTTDFGVPVLWWRSVGSTHTAYAVETMMDRLAKASGQDPVAFRLRHIKDSPRDAGVLKLAAEKAGWGKADLPKGVHRGVAVHKSFGTYVAQIADVRVRDDGTIKVERVVCAVDLGVAVDPDQIAAQMEGGIGYGLGAILRNRIDIEDGAVVQSQFFDYEPLRMSDMPSVETHIVPSADAPTGSGEPGTPPIGPAVANALLWGADKKVDDLPFSRHGLT